MYTETIDKFADYAAHKRETLYRNPLSILIGAVMAGAYVGLGVILIFSVAANVEPGWQKPLMGASFGLALILVIFAGSELFTGHTMYMTFGWLRRKVSIRDIYSVWSTVWLGNLVGAILVASIYFIGGGSVLKDDVDLLEKIAAYKVNSPVLGLVARAILCNWLVCLAIWMSKRTDSDAAKCSIIFWCLFGFIASGYEHSVANMTIFSLAILAEGNSLISVGDAMYNLFWVTIGNVIGGAIFMGVGYWLASGYGFFQKSNQYSLNSKNTYVNKVEKNEK